ncbi:unnamed protein product [Mesocestoides corti]|uniref:LIM zinc-binding domain-containing protein n=1 Tax=Mesocestoides corti TaxID=53468 RepID=A0A0R3U433_MESCO|nr:unnamed protein product [Mesocestoides corti]
MRSPTPPPPPPYAAKHTIIAAPPAVSNRTPATSPPSLVGKLPSLDPAGHRVSTALNITFSPTPSFASSSSSPARKSPSRPDTFGQVGGGGGFSVSAEVPRRHTVQRISSSSASIATPATASHGTAPPEWKPGEAVKHQGEMLSSDAHRTRLSSTPASLSPPSDVLHHHPVLLRRASHLSSSASSSSSPSPAAAIGVCSKCGARITNAASACQAMGCLYHDFCFVCCCCRKSLHFLVTSLKPPPPHCDWFIIMSWLNIAPRTPTIAQRTLRGKTFYKDQDKIYCEDDYLYCGFQRMAEKCVACGHIIAQTVSRSGLSTQLSAVGSSNRFFDWADCGCCVRLILSQFSAGVCA